MGHIRSLWNCVEIALTMAAMRNWPEPISAAATPLWLGKKSSAQAWPLPITQLITPTDNMTSGTTSHSGGANPVTSSRVTAAVLCRAMAGTTILPAGMDFSSTLLRRLNTAMVTILAANRTENTLSLTPYFSMYTSEELARKVIITPNTNPWASR